MANRIIITGRLVSDPELRNITEETVVVKFRIAVPRRFSKSDESDFFNVTAWRKTAEFVGKHFVKGKLIEVDGRLQSNPWTDDKESKHQGIFITAEHVDFVGDKPKLGESSNQSEEVVHNTDFDPFK